jgi:hypothetical protein
MKSDDVILAVRNVVENDRTKIQNIISTLTGGWESWLQVEAALGLIGALGVGATAAREQPYPVPDNARRCDLLLTPARGTRVYVELKVQNYANDNILDRFSTDVVKLQGLNSTTKTTYVLAATAFMWHFDAKTLKTYCLKMGANLKVQQWDNTKWNDTTANPVSGNLTLASFKLL